MGKKKKDFGKAEVNDFVREGVKKANHKKDFDLKLIQSGVFKIARGESKASQSESLKVANLSPESLVKRKDSEDIQKELGATKKTKVNPDEISKNAVVTTEAPKLSPKVLDFSSMEAQKPDALYLGLVKYNQVPKSSINKFVQGVLATEINKHFMVDLYDNSDDETEIIMANRPGTDLSSKKQGRHVTPISFIKEALEKIISNDSEQNLKYAAKEFLQLILKILPNKDGAVVLCDINDKVAIGELASFSSKGFISNETKKVTMLVSPKKVSLVSKKYVASKDADYNKYLHQFITNSILELDKLIPSDDHNTIRIFLEELIKNSIQLYNIKPGITYPDEGHNPVHEIRLYKSSEAASKPKTEAYKVISATEAKRLVEIGEQISGTIRLVDCEGSFVKKALEAFELLSSIFSELLNITKGLDVEKAQKKILTQVKSYNDKFTGRKIILSNEVAEKSEKLLSDYNRALPEDPKNTDVAQKVAKHLFDIFDYKALQKYVLVLDENGNLKVYDKAEAKKLFSASILDGNAYRKSISRDDLDYKKSVVYRDQENITDKVLVEKMVSHLLICVFPCTYMKLVENFKNIAKQFANIVAMDYGIINTDNFNEELDKQLTDVITSRQSILEADDIGTLVFNKEVRDYGNAVDMMGGISSYESLISSEFNLSASSMISM